MYKEDPSYRTKQEYLQAIVKGYLVQSMESRGPAKRNTRSSPPGKETSERRRSTTNIQEQEGAGTRKRRGYYMNKNRKAGMYNKAQKRDMLGRKRL